MLPVNSEVLINLKNIESPGRLAPNMCNEELGWRCLGQ